MEMEAFHRVLYLVVLIAVFHSQCAAASLSQVCSNSTKGWSHSSNNLYIVHCSGSGLTSIPDFKNHDRQNVRQIRELFLEDNEIRDFSALVSDDYSTNLKSLYLDRNSLTSLNGSWFSKTKAVQLLGLSNNRLVSIPNNVFASMPSLLWLDLKNNVISQFYPDSFAGINPQEIVLTSNTITQLLPGLFKNMNNLLRVDLSQNRISSLPLGLFNGSTALESLYLERNQLTSLQATLFCNLKQLRTLKLEENLLKMIAPDAFVSLLNLEELTLHRNQLSMLPNDTFQSQAKLENLTISGNQWVCNTDLCSGMKQLNMMVLHNTNFDCASPNTSFVAFASNCMFIILEESPVEHLTLNSMTWSLNWMRPEHLTLPSQYMISCSEGSALPVFTSTINGSITSVHLSNVSTDRDYTCSVAPVYDEVFPVTTGPHTWISIVTKTVSTVIPSTASATTNSTPLTVAGPAKSRGESAGTMEIVFIVVGVAGAFLIGVVAFLVVARRRAASSFQVSYSPNGKLFNHADSSAALVGCQQSSDVVCYLEVEPAKPFGVKPKPDYGNNEGYSI